MREAIVYARERGLSLRVLGGGSNLVVADAGVAGLVVKMATQGVVQHAHHDHVTLTVEGGESWDRWSRAAGRQHRRVKSAGDTGPWAHAFQKWRVRTGGRQ